MTHTDKEYENLKYCYAENLKLCKWQEQHINKLAMVLGAIEKRINDMFIGFLSNARKMELNEILAIIDGVRK